MAVKTLVEKLAKKPVADKVVPIKKAPLKTVKANKVGPLMLAGSTVTTNMSDVVTVITNISGKTLVLGFIPPHGKELDNNESVTIQGDLEAQLKTGGGRTWQRKLDAYNAALSDKLIRIAVQHRMIVYGKVNSNVTIAAGDLVWLDSADDSVKPASSFTWDTNIATTQTAFKAKFLGVALDSHTSGAAAVTNFRVDISPNSPRTFTCSSETHLLSSTLGPAKNPSSNAMLNTTLVKAASTASIARSRSYDSSAKTSVVVTFQSSVYGYNTSAAE